MDVVYGSAKSPGENPSKAKKQTTRMRLHIDSRDRNPTQSPSANDFRFHMAKPIRGVTAITLSDLWVPIITNPTLNYTPIVTDGTGASYALSATGPYNIVFIGTSAEYATLPAQSAATPIGSTWRIHDQSTGAGIVVMDSASNILTAITTGGTAECISLGIVTTAGWLVSTTAGLSVVATEPSYTYVVPVLADLPENCVAQYKEGAGYPNGVLGFVPLAPVNAAESVAYFSGLGSDKGQGGSWRIEFPFALGQLSELHFQLWTWAGDETGDGWGGPEHPPKLYPLPDEIIASPPLKSNNYWMVVEVEHQI